MMTIHTQRPQHKTNRTADLDPKPVGNKEALMYQSPKPSFRIKHQSAAKSQSRSESFVCSWMPDEIEQPKKLGLG